VRPYYEHAGITIYHGDCREVLPTLAPVDATVTDPPYGVGLEAKRSKVRGGGVVVRPGAYTAFEDTQCYVRDVAVPVVEACRVKSRAVVVTPGVRNLWAYPPADDLGGFYSGSGTGMSKWGFVCFQPVLFYGADPYLAAGMGSRPNATGKVYPNDANTYDHPCAKPIQMMQWLVTRASLEGQTILDPFVGSGTTLRAAKDLGRKAIGIEIEERYCEIAANRLRQEVLV
jgi:site-specific DNA-methyltransferase (adenine-specific)